METRADSLDPNVREFLDEKEATPVPPYSRLTVSGARQVVRETYGSESTIQPISTVRDLLIPGPKETELPIRVYVPGTDAPQPVLCWFHGGGFVLGGLDSHDPTCRLLAEETGYVVVSVDYRLAPEHPFPAGLKDCCAAVDWVINNAETICGNPERVAVGGQSAGGNLAAATLLRRRAEDTGSDITYQILVYPVTNHAFDTQSYTENSEGYHLTRDLMQWFWSRYLRDKIDGDNPYASVLRASDFSELPPTTLVTAGYDPLRDEGIAYGRQLEQSGVSVTHRHYEAMIHGFFAMHSDPHLPQGKDAIRGVAEDLTSVMD